MSFADAVAEGIEARKRRAFARAGGRGAAAKGAGGGGGARPVIVKAISGIRRRSGAVALVRYVARLGTDQKDPIDGAPIRDPLVRVYDESGLEVPRNGVMKALDAWGLLSDRRNGIGGDPARPRCVQVRHFVMSAPAVERRERDALVQAVAATVQETFGSEGHRCLWAMHEEHGRHPHVHVVVEARQEGTGRRLKLDRRGELLDGLRAVLARHVNALGPEDRDPSRRADREELIEQLRIAGASRDGRVVPQPRGRDPRPWLMPLDQAAPQWWRANGASALKRQGERLARKRAWREAARSSTNDAPPVDGPPSPRAERKAARGIAGLFDRLVGRPAPATVGDPGSALEARLGELGVFRVDGRDRTSEAVRSFIELREEGDPRKRGLAEWTLRKRPWLFAEVSSEWRRIERDDAVRRAIEDLPAVEPVRASPPASGGQGTESADELLKWARVERERAILVRSLAGLAGSIERLGAGDGRSASEAAELRERAYDVATAPREAILAVVGKTKIDREADRQKSSPRTDAQDRRPDTGRGSPRGRGGRGRGDHER